MTRIKDCCEVTGNAPIDMIWVKTANGRTFIKKGLEISEEFITLVASKTVTVISDYCPKVFKVVTLNTQNARITTDNSKAFLEIAIKDLSSNDSYYTTIKDFDFTVTREFLKDKTIAELKSWASARNITVKATKKADIVNELL